jgi:mRNA interferase HigB
LLIIRFPAIISLAPRPMLIIWCIVGLRIYSSLKPPAVLRTWFYEYFILIELSFLSRSKQLLIYQLDIYVKLIYSLLERIINLRIISKKKIHDYCIISSQAELPLVEWYYKMKASQATNFNDLKTQFNGVDYKNGYTIFNIGGNNYRLIAAIHYRPQLCYVRQIWTHAEYSKPYNQTKLNTGAL